MTKFEQLGIKPEENVLEKFEHLKKLTDINEMKALINNSPELKHYI